MAREIQLVQASSGEASGKGGFVKGDQTGKETNVRMACNKNGGWARSAKWEEVIIPDSSISNEAALAATIGIKAATCSLVGYDQGGVPGHEGDRLSFYKELEKNDWNIDKYIKSGVPSECDCASFVFTCWAAAYPPLREYMTKNKWLPACQAQKMAFEKFGNGKFTCIKWGEPDQVCVGTVLNDPDQHSAMVCSVDGSVPITENKYTGSAYDVSGLGVGANVGSSTGGYSGNVISGPPIGRNDQIHIPGQENRVYNLSSVSRVKHTSAVNSSRNNAFKSLRNSMVNNAPKMGRKIITMEDLQDSNILKGTQESRKEKLV